MAGDWPENWQTCRIEDCMAAIIDYRGKTPRKTVVGIPLITAKVVKGGRIETPNEFIDPGEYVEWMRRGLPKRGDVLVTTEAPLGEVAQISDAKVALAQRLIALRGKPEVLDNTFLKFLMQSTFVQSQLLARASGTTVSGIKQSELRKVELPLPPLPTQQAIACILGALDDKIELNRRINQTLEEMARALFKSWFVDFDPVRAKAAGQPPPGLKPEIAPLFPDSFEASELGEIPKGWRSGTVADLGLVVCGKTPPTKDSANYGNEIPFVTIPDMHGQIFVTATSKMLSNQGAMTQENKFIDAKSICVSCIATPGLVVITSERCQTNQQINSVIPGAKTNPYHSYFVLRNLGDQIRAGGSGGSVFHNLNKSLFSRLKVLLPPAQVVEAFGLAAGPFLEGILARQRASTTLARLRNTLLPKLLSGEIDLPVVEELVEGVS